MVRVKRGVTQRKRHKKVLKAAKGFRGQRGNLFRQAKQAVMKAGLHAYRHRRAKKRDLRALWILRINAATRAQGMSYSRFIAALQTKGILLDRKMLAFLAATHPQVFDEIVKSVAVSATPKKAVAPPKAKKEVSDTVSEAVKEPVVEEIAVAEDVAAVDVG